jgi:putative peptidoglycan lipid II flippase
VRLVFFIGLPAGVGLMIVRHPITEVILQGGQFQQSDTDRVAFVLLGYAASVWAYALVQVLTRAFYARDEVMTPVRLAMAMVVLNLALNLTLIWTPLREAGLAWSTAICAAIQAVIMAAILHRRGVGLTQESVIASLGRTIVLTAVMAIGLVVVSASMPVSTGWSGAAVELAVLTIVGTAIYGGGAVLIRMPEWRWALGQTGD